VHVVADVVSIAPAGALDIIVNGKIAASAIVTTAGATPFHFEGDVELPRGGWVAARVMGSSTREVADSYAFAQTSPVYVVRDGKPFISAEDATFLAEVVDAIWARAARSPWRSDAERDAFKREIDQARSVYLRLASH
jgi:hypothetical protein